MLAWIVGSGGMLGSALVKRIGSDAQQFDANPVPWSDPADALETLVADLDRFWLEAGDEPWVLIWAAGSSVVASRDSETEPELRILEGLLTALAERLPIGAGAVFLTSSAGGVYAGSNGPPFDDLTDPVPVSPYGMLKLAQEASARRILSGRTSLVIGRFSNLYGADFNPTKGQGLIQQLCVASLRRRPLNLYVSMDTVRDYLFVDDAASLAWTAIEMTVRTQPEEPIVAIIASGEPTTVSRAIATIENVTHRRVPIALGTHPSSRHQVIDLRLVPSTERLAGRVAATSLPTGIKRVIDAIAGRVT